MGRFATHRRRRLALARRSYPQPLQSGAPLLYSYAEHHRRRSGAALSQGTTRNSARPDCRIRATQKYARWPGQPTGLEPSPRYLSPSKGAARAP